MSGSGLCECSIKALPPLVYSHPHSEGYQLDPTGIEDASRSELETCAIGNS